MIRYCIVESSEIDGYMSYILWIGYYDAIEAHKSIIWSLISLIRIPIIISLLPQIPSLPHNLRNINLDRLISIDIDLYTGSINICQIFYDLFGGLMEIVFAVLVLHVGDGHVEAALGGEVDAVLVLGDLVGDLDAGYYWCLVRPASGYIAQGVPAATKE